MIRVGFVVAGSGKGWMGGLNYIANLLHAVRTLPDRRISPVLLASPSVPQSVLDGLPADEVVRTRLASPSGPVLYGRKGAERLLGRDLPMELYLRARRIAVLSHSGLLGRRAAIPTLAWLPDFQHRHLPHLFDAADRAARDRAAGQAASAATRIIVSSHDALRDLGEARPEAVGKARVLHFVSGFGGVSADPDPSAVTARYGLSGPYFHLPNQFWAHKNHRVVLDALALLKSRGVAATVVATGHTDDHRNPAYFPDLMRHAEGLGLGDRFRVLGLVPYGDLAGLMRHAVAVINPSLFEGWSTTVEEAKSQGKRLLLSDIAVHREQDPARAAFFPAQDRDRLAELMQETLEAFDPREEIEAGNAAAADLPRRFLDFGRRYERIVLDAAG